MADPVLTWRVHPAGERKGLTVAVSLVILGVSALTGIWMDGVTGVPMEGLYWSLFALLVLLLSLESYFLPTRFTLSGGEVAVEKIFSRTRRSWSDIRGAWFDRVGVTLSPFARRHWLEPYRSVRLRYPRPGRSPSEEDIRAFLRAKLDPARVAITGLEENASSTRSPKAG